MALVLRFTTYSPGTPLERKQVPSRRDRKYEIEPFNRARSDFVITFRNMHTKDGYDSQNVGRQIGELP